MTTTTTTVSRPRPRVPNHRSDLSELPRALWPLSKAAVIKLALFLPLTRHRAAATAEQVAVAHLTTAVHEDCGACLRIAIRQARAAGLPHALERAVIEGRRDDLPTDLALAHQLATDVLADAAAATATAREVARRLGEKVLADLALTIAVARFYPTAKRGLGLAVACSLAATDV